MILKHFFIWIILFFSFQSVVNAQIHGLSIVDTADPAGKGTMHIVCRQGKQNGYFVLIRDNQEAYEYESIFPRSSQHR